MTMCFEVTCSSYGPVDGIDYYRGDRLLSEVELDKKWKNAFKRVPRLFTPREKVAQKLEAKKKEVDRVRANLVMMRDALSRGGFDQVRASEIMIAESRYGELEAEAAAIKREHDAMPETPEDRIATLPKIDPTTEKALREKVLAEFVASNADIARALQNDPELMQRLGTVPSPLTSAPTPVDPKRDATALAARGVDVTDKFPKVKALQEELRVFQRGDTFHVYQGDDVHPVHAKGLKASEVDAVATRASTSLKKVPS